MKQISQNKIYFYIEKKALHNNISLSFVQVYVVTTVSFKKLMIL